MVRPCSASSRGPRVDPKTSSGVALRCLEDSLESFPHFSFRVHLVVSDIQECFRSQCPTGECRAPHGCRRAKDIGSYPSRYERDPLPLRPRLREPQEVKHPRLVEDDRAHDEVKSPHTQELHSLRHGLRTEQLMTRKDPFNNCAWFRRRRYQDSSHPSPITSRRTTLRFLCRAGASERARRLSRRLQRQLTRFFVDHAARESRLPAFGGQSGGVPNRAASGRSWVWNNETPLRNPLLEGRLGAHWGIASESGLPLLSRRQRQLTVAR
jgi:hypothetical protein